MRRTRHASSDRSYYRVKFAVKYSVLTLISSARLLYEKIQKYIILLHYYCTVCTHDEYIIARDLCARYVRCTCNYSGKKKKRNDLPNDLYRTGFSNWIEQPCGTAGKRAIICGVSLKKTKKKNKCTLLLAYSWRNVYQFYTFFLLRLSIFALSTRRPRRGPANGAVVYDFNCWLVETFKTKKSGYGKIHRILSTSAA